MTTMGVVIQLGYLILRRRLAQKTRFGRVDVLTVIASCWGSFLLVLAKKKKCEVTKRTLQKVLSSEVTTMAANVMSDASHGNFALVSLASLQHDRR